MTGEEKELFEAYKIETEKCWEIAQWIDSRKPHTPGSFTGTPSERIMRQLTKLLEQTP